MPQTPSGSYKDATRPPAHPRTRLLHDDAYSDNGTFTPIASRPVSPGGSDSHSDQPSSTGGSVLRRSKWLTRTAATTSVAEEAGVKRPWLMYVSYYVPVIAWVGRYEWSFLVGDVAAGGACPLPRSPRPR